MGISNTSHVNMVIASVIDICKRFGVKTVILFGSRATGLAVEKSDIDIAIQGGEINLASIVNETEKIPSLLSVNIVELSETSGNLRKDIESHGKLLYKA